MPTVDSIPLVKPGEQPTRADLLRKELGRLRHENTNLACELAREQSKSAAIRPWVQARETN